MRLLAVVAVDEVDEDEEEVEDSLPLLLFELSLWVRELPGLAAGAAVVALVDEPVELVSLSMKRLGVASVAAGAGADGRGAADAIYAKKEDYLMFANFETIAEMSG